MITNVHLVNYQNGIKSQIVKSDTMTAFQEEEPYGYALTQVRAVLADGYWYTVDSNCPDSGYLEWSNIQSPEELALESKILALPIELREHFAPGFMTRAERIIAKTIDDAEADARAAQALL